MTNEDMLVSIWPSIRMMPTFPTPPQRLAQYTWPSLVSWSCKSFQINQRTGYRVRAVVQDTKYIPLSFSSPSPLGGGYKPQIWRGMPLEGYDISQNFFESVLYASGHHIVHLDGSWRSCMQRKKTKSNRLLFFSHKSIPLFLAAGSKT